MPIETLHLIETGGDKKGDVIAVARVAGIHAAKRCAELTPMCHSLLLTGIDGEITLDALLDALNSCVQITTACRLKGVTGVEMEALTVTSRSLH